MSGETKILVTGGAGFIGSAVIREAISRGMAVVNVDALTYAACPENLSSVADAKCYAFARVDLRDRDALDAVFEKHRPDGVIHLAAESHVDRSIDGPADCIGTNIVGTFNLLEAARAYWIGAGRPQEFRFHHVSTDEVYGSLALGEGGQFTEQSAYDPSSPYSASKAASDHLVKAWHRTYGLPTLATNGSNTYGPYQFPEKLVPLTILNAIHDQPLTVYGDGANVRDWIHVTDHAAALLAVFENGWAGRSYNIGGENERSNIDIVRRLCAILDEERPRGDGRSYAEQIAFVADRPGHDARYAVDPARLRDEIGWQPSMPLSDGLRDTVRWYLDNAGWWKPLLGRSAVGRRLGAAE